MPGVYATTSRRRAPRTRIPRMGKARTSLSPGDSFVMEGPVHPSSSQASATRFSTLAVPPRQRIEFWKDAICAAFVPLDFECDAGRPFASDLTIRHTPRFDLVDVRGSPQQVKR